MIRLFKSARSASKIIAVVGLILVCRVTPASADMIDSQTLRYAASYTNIEAGEFRVVIERDGGQIKTTVSSDFNILAKAILGESVAEAWFHADGEHAILDRGRLSEPGADTAAGFVVDYDDSVIKLDSGKNFSIAPGETGDATEFPLALITGDIESVAGQIIWEINPRRARRYQFHAPEQELLDLNGRQYDTWKVTRNKLGDTSRTVTIWLDRDNQNIPLKIITTKDGRNTILTLID